MSKDDENYVVVVNPNGDVLGQMSVKYKETGESIPVNSATMEFRKAVQEEIDAMIMETIHKKAVQDAKKKMEEKKTHERRR